jgi:hypothetical protein
VQKWIKFFGCISGVKPKVSKLLRRHLSGELHGKEEVAPMVGACWKDIWNHGASPCCSNILRMVQCTWEAVVTAFKWLVGPPGPGGCGSPSTELCRWAVSKTDNKIDPSQMEGKEPPSTIWAPEIAKQGKCCKPQRHWRERLQGEPNKGMWTHQRMSGVGCERGQSGGWVLASHVLRVVVGWVGIRVPTRISGETLSESRHQM